MNNTKKRFTVIITGILVAFLLPLEIALAAPDQEMGCILRQPGQIKFVRSNFFPDKKAIGEAAVNAHRMSGTRVIDPCLTGKVRNIPARVYAKLAEKYPEKFQPLEVGDQSSALEAITDTAPHVAPEYRYVGINGVILPETETIFTGGVAITNGNRVYGTAFTNSVDGKEPFSSPFAAVFEHGAITVFHESKGMAVTTASQNGVFGGLVITDFENFFAQAALFHGNKLQLIPQLPGEFYSEVVLGSVDISHR